VSLRLHTQLYSCASGQPKFLNVAVSCVSCHSNTLFCALGRSLRVCAALEPAAQENCVLCQRAASLLTQEWLHVSHMTSNSATGTVLLASLCSRCYAFAPAEYEHSRQSPGVLLAHCDVIVHKRSNPTAFLPDPTASTSNSFKLLYLVLWILNSPNPQITNITTKCINHSIRVLGIRVKLDCVQPISGV
jgi:hypothetical protein